MQSEVGSRDRFDPHFLAWESFATVWMLLFEKSKKNRKKQASSNSCVVEARACLNRPLSHHPQPGQLTHNYFESLQWMDTPSQAATSLVSRPTPA